MDRESKKNTVKNLKENFKDSEGVVVTHYLGLNNSELTELRIKVKEVGAKFCVAKITTPPDTIITLVRITNAFFFFGISENRIKNTDIGRNATVNTFENMDNK